jgi:hypothetical protein
LERPAQIAPDGPLAFAEAEALAPRTCIFARARASLSEQQQGELDFMIASPKYSVSVIFRALNSLGHSMSRASVDHHLKGDCPCSR